MNGVKKEGKQRNNNRAFAIGSSTNKSRLGQNKVCEERRVHESIGPYCVCMWCVGRDGCAVSVLGVSHWAQIGPTARSAWQKCPRRSAPGALPHFACPTFRAVCSNAANLPSVSLWMAMKTVRISEQVWSGLVPPSAYFCPIRRPCRSKPACPTYPTARSTWRASCPTCPRDYSTR